MVSVCFYFMHEFYLPKALSDAADNISFGQSVQGSLQISHNLDKMNLASKASRGNWTYSPNGLFAAHKRGILFKQGDALNDALAYVGHTEDAEYFMGIVNSVIWDGARERNGEDVAEFLTVYSLELERLVENDAALSEIITLDSEIDPELVEEYFAA